MPLWEACPEGDASLLSKTILQSKNGALHLLKGLEKGGSLVWENNLRHKLLTEESVESCHYPISVLCLYELDVHCTSGDTAKHHNPALVNLVPTSCHTLKAWAEHLDRTKTVHKCAVEGWGDRELRVMERPHLHLQVLLSQPFAPHAVIHDLTKDSSAVQNVDKVET